jgi:hypothetical protein
MAGRNCSCLSPLFLALQVNTGLKQLRIDFLSFSLNDEHIDEELSSAMRLGLGRTSTLESLHLSNIISDGYDILLWRETFSSLRTNIALKALHMNFVYTVTESHATAIRMEVLAVLCDNESLETLSMISERARFDDYLVSVAAIQLNTTLKSLNLHHPVHGVLFCVDQHEIKGLILVLKKNFGLEAIPELHRGMGDVHSILQLNGVGCRYLVQDGSSISKGVDVLSGVSNDINSVFLHLLENPRLCDRSAVETLSISNLDNTRSTSPRNHGTTVAKVVGSACDLN